MEDDIIMASEIKLFLTNQGFICDIINDGGKLFETDPEVYDMYLLDINVPTLNGIGVCKRLRDADHFSPVLMLTAYGAVSDKVQALESGADDYLVKPFHFEELLARIKALLRRTNKLDKTNDVLYKVSDLIVNITDFSVIRAGKKISLTPKEYKLLKLLITSNGRIVSKRSIASEVWDLNFETGTNTIEVYINFLRTKIDKDHDVKLIHTRQGYGYYLKVLD